MSLERPGHERGEVVVPSLSTVPVFKLEIDDLVYGFEHGHGWLVFTDPILVTDMISGVGFVVIIAHEYTVNRRDNTLALIPSDMDKWYSHVS